MSDGAPTPLAGAAPDDGAQASGRAPVVVLFEPQNPLNVGATVRACRNFGVDDLRVLRPGQWDPDTARVTAPHGDDFFAENVNVVDEWADAIAGTKRLYAFTARSREERQRRLPLAEAAAEWAASPDPVGLVFGREDHGLPNEIVHRCDVLVTIDTEAEASSLNLAQAVIVALHRAFEARHGVRPPPPPRRQFEPADKGQIERMLGTAEEGLEAIAFFKGDQRANVMRTIARIVNKAEVDTQELATLWALFAELKRVGRDG